MTPTKHFAFLLHYPSKGKFLMWPGFYEDHKAEIDKSFSEVEHDVSDQIGFHAIFEKNPYKVFVKKVKQNKSR